MGSGEVIQVSLEDIEVIKTVAVQGAKLEILVEDFQTSKKETNDNLGKLFELLRSNAKHVTDCKDELEKDIEKVYMTKKDGEILEQHLANNIRSIKLWIVSSVGGFSAAGVLMVWALKLIG